MRVYRWSVFHPRLVIIILLLVRRSAGSLELP